MSMIQDQYTETQIDTETHMRPVLTSRRTWFTHTLRLLLLAVGLAFLLTCLEALLWLMNPGHLFGRGFTYTLLSFLALPLHTPLLLLVPVFEVLLAFWLVYVVAQPLAKILYLSAASRGEERYRASYTPLQRWSYPYDIPVVYTLDSPNPTIHRQEKVLSILELVEAVVTASPPHLLLQGARGSGKTMFVHEALSTIARRWREIAFGRSRVPIVLPLKYYASLRQAPGEAEDTNLSLLDFAAVCDFPGVAHLRPYLKKLFLQGRLLFLCDGLDEVPDLYRADLDLELMVLLRQSQNVLLLTCTPQVLERSPDLLQCASENLVPHATIQPLDQAHMRGVVERFVTEMDARYNPHLPTAGQVMAAIERSRLRLSCADPLYLFAFLEQIAVRPVEEVRKQLDTRGHLLRAFVRMRLESRAQVDDTLADVLFFLRSLACVAYWSGGNDVLLLPENSFVQEDLDTSRAHLLLGEKTRSLLHWAQEQQVIFPFAYNQSSALAETFSPEQVLNLLQKASRAGLIDIDARGLLSFCHPLIAATLRAEYLASFLGTEALRLTAIEVFPDDLASWSEPLTLWAGLLRHPLEAADALAFSAREHPEQRVGALLVSLICLGVAQTPPSAERQQSLLPPPELAAALTSILDDSQELTSFALHFMQCARQGSPELYQALFPLLAIDGIEAFLVLLNPEPVTELFFQRLMEVIDAPEYEPLVKRLVRALSCWGRLVVPRAAQLCSVVSGYGGRLRTAAINILGGTRDQGAVDPLVDCLRDPEQFIVNRAANALIRLGPKLTLLRLVQELEMHSSVTGKKPLHWIILPLLERFLNETNPARQLTPAQYERTIDALMFVVTTHTIPADLEKARELLVSQSKLAEKQESGKIAISMLVQNLSTSDDMVAQSMTGTLKAVGQAATPRLLEELERQTSQAERVRILEILASLQDQRAIPALLRLLTDESVAVQEALVATFRVYTPACIPGLLDAVLHHSEELVAARAEFVLSEIGELAVEPTIHVLTPPVVGRTVLLVHVLERGRDRRAVPALISLLAFAQSDLTLTVAIIQALGQLSDQRVVLPLLELLGSSNPLLYEGAINALSNLGELACDDLLNCLDVSEKTPLVSRVERVLLGMQAFPGEHLLRVLDDGSETQVRYTEEIFLTRGPDAAQFLVLHLFHPQAHVRERVRRLVEHMDGHYSVPALLEVLQRPDPAWRALIATYLLSHQSEALPPLVGLLDDPQRGEAAVSILLQAGRSVLTELVPAMDSPNELVRERARHILVMLLSSQPGYLEDAVQLFGLALPPHARDLLVDVLTSDLAELALPVLMAGLEDAHLVADSVEVLVLQAQQGMTQCNRVLEHLLQALRSDAARYGASLALIDLGSLAVTRVGALITDPEAEVARYARQILGEIGTPAFPFLWAAHSDSSDPARREAAREVFRAMPTGVIKDELVMLLTSARHEEISMALALLLERIHDEGIQPGRGGEMLSALLDHIQSSSDERIGLRVLALLILLGGQTVTRALVDALYANPQRHEHLVQAFLLLGQGVEADLLAVLLDDDAPIQLQAEAAGILSMRTPQREVQERALALSEHGLWAGRSAQSVTTVLQPSQLNISLRSLGGLLVAGHWSADELKRLRSASKNGSVERELYDILLGWRYSPQITRLEHDLEIERDERRQELFAHTQELLTMKTQAVDLEHDLEQLKQEHADQHSTHERVQKEHQERAIQLDQEKQQLQTSLRQATQEKQTLAASLKQSSLEKQTLASQITQEKERLQNELKRWQTRCQQLEQEVLSLRRPQA